MCLRTAVLSTECRTWRSSWLPSGYSWSPSPSFGAQHHLSSLTSHGSLSTPGQGPFITLCSAPCHLGLRIISSLSFPGPLTLHDVFSAPSYGKSTQIVTFCHCTLPPACSCWPRGPGQSIHGMGKALMAWDLFPTHTHLLWGPSKAGT